MELLGHDANHRIVPTVETDVLSEDALLAAIHPLPKAEGQHRDAVRPIRVPPTARMRGPVPS